MSSGFITIDELGTILACNSHAAKLFGYEVEELLNRSLHSLLPELPSLSIPSIGEQQESPSQTLSFQSTGIRREGDTFHAHIELSRFQINDQILYSGYLQEEQHPVMQHFFHSFMNYSTNAVILTDQNKQILMVNHAFELLYQWSKDEAPRSVTTIVPEDKAEELLDLFHSVTSGNHIGSHPMIHKRKDGSLFDACVRIYPIVDPSGIPVQYVFVSRDFSERKKHEEELRMAKEYLESFISNTADAIGLFDMNGNLIHVNRASEEIFGWSASEQLGKPVQTIPSSDYLDEVYYMQERVRSGESIRGYETKRMRKDGKLIDVSISYSPIRDSSGKTIAFANILRDISESKRVEKALRESESKYRLIAENMSDIIQIMNKDGIITYASPSHLQILGFPSSHYEGSNACPYVHPDDIEKVLQIFTSMSRTKHATSFDMRYLHRNGNWVDLEVRCMPILDSSGLVDTYISVARDITERKQTDEYLRNSDKLSIIGQLAAGIAHEIRNPLTSLRGFLQLMNTNGSHFAYYDIMVSELDRINFIASELLLLAKPQAVTFKETNITLLVEDVIRLLDAQAILNNVQIIPHFDNELPAIKCEENQLKQVFINILKNSLEAMPEGGTIQVKVSMPDRNHIQLRFIDEGCGIPEDRLPKLGEPFYTTKEKGTGLGLMVSYKIIRNHQGNISIQSSLHKGTTVEINLPLHSGERIV